MPQDSTPPPPETQHTALPWQRNGQTLQGWWRIDGCSERVGLEFMANPVAVMPNDADADLAVRAVNNHESLLAALEGLGSKCRQCRKWHRLGCDHIRTIKHPDPLDCCDEACESASAAIAAVEVAAR